MVKGEKYLKTTVIPRTFREHCLELLKKQNNKKQITILYKFLVL